MGRKRGRPEWDRRSTTSKPSGESNRPFFNPNKGRSSIVISLLIFVACPAISLYLYPILYASNPDASIPNVLDVTYQQIENAKVSENASRQFPNPVLAYVTPW
ncbi:hypothetical protein Hanom_Chr04g00280011 [Helianthus anomalus]